MSLKPYGVILDREREDNKSPTNTSDWLSYGRSFLCKEPKINKIGQEQN
jgi:hypothetical protein